MSKIEEFKDFVKNNPILINHIKNGHMSWQKFYEIYDLYGEDEGVWNTYFSYDDNKSDDNLSGNSFKKFEEFVKMAKKVDIDKVQDGLTSLQKTLTLFGDLFINKETSGGSSYNPRPLYRKFDD